MKLVLTEEIQERELCAQGEVLVRCRCMLPKLQPLPPRAPAAVGALPNGAGSAMEPCL